MSMSLSQFIDKWIGKKADWDNAYQGQCVDLARFYWDEVMEIKQPKGVVGAADFWTNYSTDPVLNENFEQIKNTTEFIPEAGDVMIWNKRAGGGFGHIAIVKSGKQDTFVSFDQNWSKISYCELVEHNYTNVYGVLRPKKVSLMVMYKGLDLSNQDSMKVAVNVWDEVVNQKLWIKKDAAEIEKQSIIRERDEAISVSNSLKSFRTDLAYNLGCEDNTVAITGSVKSLLTVHEQLEVANKMVTSLQSDNADLEKKLNELSVRLADLKAEHQNEIDIMTQKHNQDLLNLNNELAVVKSQLVQNAKQDEQVNQVKAFIQKLIRAFNGEWK